MTGTGQKRASSTLPTFNRPGRDPMLCALHRPALFAFIGVLLIYNGATLGRVPAFLNDDDGGYASAAYQFWQTGKAGGPGFKDVVGLGRDVWAYGRTAAAAQGVFLHFAGVSILAGLLPSFLIGLGLVGATAALGRALWGSHAGLLASLLLAASGKFFEACRWARPDILVALYFTLGLWFVASASAEEPGRRLCLAGLLMGMAGDVHLNGFLIAPLPLLFWLVLRPQTVRTRMRGILLYTGGASIGAVWWLALHYWPDPHFFWRQATLFGLQTHRVRVLALGPLGSLRSEWMRYTDWFWAARGHRHLFEGLCVMSAAVWMWRREARIGRALMAVWLAFFLIASAFMSNPYGWYLILVWPLFALWMARMFIQFPLRLTALAALLVLLAAYLADLALWGWKAWQDTPLQAHLSELRQLVPADAPVLGNGALWFAFWDRDFTDQYYLTFREIEVRLNPGSGPTGWNEEQKRRGWRYIAAYGDLRRSLDPDVPLADLLASESWGRAAQIREARAFSLARCSIERRIRGYSDSILVLRIREGSTTH